MNLHKLIFTENDCYKSNVAKNSNIAPQGLFLHSTGVNNPWVKRYVGPDDGYCGKNAYNNHWNQKMSREVCTHGFIGKAGNGEICSYQTLPWNFFGWHSGSGSKGSANYMGYLGFEICEDGLTDKNYFNAIYKEAVELFAYLAVEFNIKPEKPYIICHSEGHALGIASNHGDVMHWFKKHNKTMDNFRADVAAQIKKLKGEEDKKKEDGTFEVNDIVQFLGGNVYSNANAASATTTAKAGPAKLTRTYNGKHPYHLVHTDKQSSVYGWVDANCVQAIQTTEVKKEEPKKEEPKKEEVKPVVVDKNTFKVGDIVNYKGKNHYSNANATKPAATNRKAGQAKVTAKYSTGKHPYHLVAVSGKGSNVYGWVDCADIEAPKAATTTTATTTSTTATTSTATTFKKGDKVKVNKGAKTYSGGSLASYVYTTTYEVIQVSGDRVVIGLGSAVTAAMNAKDLKKV